MKLRNLGKNQTEITLHGSVAFFSYGACVAAFIPGDGYVRTEKRWSATTTRHINKWLDSNNARDHATERPQAFFDAFAERVA